MTDIDTFPEPDDPAPLRRTQFGSLSIAYNSRVLEPRAWTMAQSRWAAELLAASNEPRLLELCSGAGQIGLLAAHLSPAPTLLVDADLVACQFATANAAQVSAPVEVRCATIAQLMDESERYSIVIADPPWVPTADVGQFLGDPVTAIDGGTDGLDLARACLATMVRCLRHDGVGILQLGSLDQVMTIRGDLTSELVVDEVRHYPGCGVLVSLHRPG